MYKLIKNTISLFVLASASISHAHGKDTNSSSYSISGMIDFDVRDYILDIDDDHIILDVNSPGGMAGPSIDIAEHLRAAETEIYVAEICNSACSQILLAAAEKIYFIDKPFVGFHWSMSLSASEYERHGGDIRDCPDLKSLRASERTLLQDKGLNPDFYQELRERIVPKNFRFIEYEHDECLGYDFELEHSLWFPTSMQLENLLGLKFEGEVCADDFEMCARRIADLAIKEGATSDFSVVIGDEIFRWSAD